MNRVRMYRHVLRALMVDMLADGMVVGASLPAERALASRYKVSRGTVGEALTALEVMGLIEIRAGAGARVRRLPTPGELSDRPSASSELLEAMLLFEGEGAALAAVQASQAELGAIRELALSSHRCDAGAGRAFHLAVAQATHNGAVYAAIERLWNRTATWAAPSDRAAATHDHMTIALALGNRDAAAARCAMRRHVSGIAAQAWPGTWASPKHLFASRGEPQPAGEARPAAARPESAARPLMDM